MDDHSTYNTLREQAYLRALDALLAYQRFYDCVTWNEIEEEIILEANGLKITIQPVNI